MREMVASISPCADSNEMTTTKRPGNMGTKAGAGSEKEVSPGEGQAAVH